MFDPGSLSPFGWVVTVCIAVMAGSIMAGIILALRSRDELTRTVLSDLVFYGMLCVYFSWSLLNNAALVYDIAVLGAIAGGVLPTLSMARVISKGRR